MSVESNKDVVLGGWASVSKNDLQGMGAMYADDVVYHGAGGEEARGKDAVLAMLSGYFTGFSEMRATVEDVFGEGDRVFTRARIEGTNTGELFGMPATGKRLVLNWVMNVSRLADGKVVEEWEIFDRVDMLTQLGHMPAEG